jgi:hypothetical protein
MSRMGSTLGRHRKDYYSFDIKGVYKTAMVQSSFYKKR